MTILANGRAIDSGGGGDELDGPVPAVPPPQANVVAVLMGDDPEAVVLQLVRQPGPVGTLRERTGLQGRMDPGGWRRSRANGANRSLNRRCVFLHEPAFHSGEQRRVGDRCSRSCAGLNR